VITKLRPTKALGYDLITGEILKKLPEVGLSAVTYIYNSILCTGYFPGQSYAMKTKAIGILLHS